MNDDDDVLPASCYRPKFVAPAVGGAAIIARSLWRSLQYAAVQRLVPGISAKGALLTSRPAPKLHVDLTILFLKTQHSESKRGKTSFLPSSALGLNKIWVLHRFIAAASTLNSRRSSSSSSSATPL